MDSHTTEETQDNSLVERLFRAGAHYGFSKSRRHPTAAPYLFSTKQGTDIFDLEKTSRLLADAKEYLSDIAAKGGVVLLVGTKEEVKEIVKSCAIELSMPSVTNRWIGGTLTNFSQIQKRINYLANLRAEQASGELDRKYTKKERLLLGREMERLVLNFGGITAMERPPAVLLVVDPRHEALAVREARDMHIPVIAIMSSDCNADRVDWPVYLNDAHRSSVALALDELAAGYKNGLTRAQAAPAAREGRAS
ncbi:30S ribosomal protein S2 [Candidatus Kaiserbacteria bacterium]|nr:30S ribosomal protein S2 [Candidatus Kaiserbacteria bacterium]